MAKKADDKKSKERASEYEDTRFSINGSFDDVLRASLPKIMKDSWHFKSGEALPKIEPKNYVLTGIKCNTGTIPEIKMELRHRKGLDTGIKPMNVSFFSSLKYKGAKKTEGFLNENINCSIFDECSIVVSNEIKDYDFIISYNRT